MRVSLLLLCLSFVGPLGAQEALPEPGLLEFLGSFETAEGQWFDPTELELPIPPPADLAQVEGEE